MNAKQLKSAFLSDIDALIEITAEDAREANGCTLASLLEVQEPLTPKKRAEITENYLKWAEGSRDNWSFEYGAGKYEFSPVMAPSIRAGVIHFPEGNKQTSNGTGTGKNLRCNQMQEKIADMRELYQGRSYVKPEENEAQKNRIIMEYKKAAKGDLIRLCWSYITNPVELEGVHVAWKEEPKVKFEPYLKTVKI